MLSKRDQLRQLIGQWNENRLDLFALSEPDENLEFHGVMRFYYKEPGEKVSTKCIRVSNAATTSQIVEVLIEKFHPDMKMLTDQEYSIWEIHENGEERRLLPDEHPLLVQLTWHKDDREGRFLLRSTAASHYLPLSSLQFDATGANLKRNQKRFSKRDKKSKGKEARDELIVRRDRRPRAVRGASRTILFTRTISNPEAVMKKRREKKLESKLNLIGSNGANGGSLKIYGGEVVPNRPYVTLLVVHTDTAAKIVSETLEKYDLAHENPEDFVLVEITFADPNSVSPRSLSDLKTVGQHQERCLHDQESPLECLTRNMERRVETLFVLRHRPTNFPAQHGRLGASTEFPESTRLPVHEDPALVSLPQNAMPTAPFFLKPGVNHVGSDFSIPGLHINSNLIRPRHCVLVLNEEGVSLSPVDGADVRVNEQAIRGPVRLRDGDVVRLSGSFGFAFCQSFALQNGGQLNGDAHAFGLDSTRQVHRLVAFDQSPAFSPHDPTYETTQFDAATNSVVSISRPPTAMRLVAVLEVPDHVAEECFLNEVVGRLHAGELEFALTPAFCFYMICRHRLTAAARPGLNPELHDVGNFVNTVVDRVCHFVHVNAYNRSITLFWLSNLSEFLHVIKADVDLNAATGVHLQSKLMRIVSECFKLHVESGKVELGDLMPAFLDTTVPTYDAVRGVLAFLHESIQLCRRMKLNASLIIQAFSHLLHFINAYSFNWLLSPIWSKGWSTRLKCHLDRIAQAVNLLVTPKTVDQIASLGATCYRLNSLQVEFLLKHYRREPTELPISNELIQNVVLLAREQADQAAHEEGEGYTIESLRGIPNSMLDFISGLQQRGICRLIPLDGADGSWTVHFARGTPLKNSSFISANWNSSLGADDYAAVQKPRYAAEVSPMSSGRGYSNGSAASPRRIVVQLRRPEGTGFGLSIVAAQAAGDRYLSIYVKKVIEGSPAYKPDRPPSAPKMTAAPEPPPQYGALLTSRSSSSVPFASAASTSAPHFVPNSPRSQPPRSPAQQPAASAHSPYHRNQQPLPFLNELQTNSLTKHQDGLMRQIELLEKTANRLESPVSPDRRNHSPDEKAKKKVQFAEEENGHTSTSSNASESPRPLHDAPARQPKEEEEDEEPRAQVFGKHEVYNDPRQRRLNEIQARSLKPVVEGEKLGFRDKMRMFAKEIGEEHTPKSKHKISSAQREIERDGNNND
ncbi:Afadin [Aphelenchoides fujianensis]|nr:Afadin [Aphelenchoides fujianensis]